MTIGNRYRITILTSRLIRMEYQRNGIFVDEATQAVVNRNFPSVEYSTLHEKGRLIIETDDLIFSYDGEEFSPEGLSIEVKATGNVWHYSVVYGNSDRNLYGTARTLDGADGGIMLEPGIFGENGYAVIDDSNSAILGDGGEYVSRRGEGIDIYFFGYGTDFAGGLRDFYHLCGQVPMIPRYALGNWWSRYYRYSEKSYNEMLDKMAKENIPLSVAVIDMDWHITDVDPKYGTGWTGYTWDKELFPDYKRFLKNLKDRGLATTLNLHPADGIRAFETQYEAMAKEMDFNTREEKAIEFDFADKKFRNAYFKCVMNPYEDDGVDFWWIDWQQGTKKGGSDIDPLFLLNHYHYEDRKRNNNRPMIFSRYAGVGSHRYPLGFSGDTVATWKSLAFQPYFTATASNIGYGWWSHDIGGHMMGDKNEERLIRWIQYGVFSPVMRLHSSCSEFFNKEPWNVASPYRQIMGRYLRLRHQLIPYTYTMSYEAHINGEPLIQPMYYKLSDDKQAYKHKNEYFFGDSLLVGAITKETSKSLRMSHINMLIPEGRWYDIFNGRVYGNGVKNLYRSVDNIPVLLKAGGIVPLSLEEGNGVDNPTKLRLLVGAGADGEFSMYEDDGSSLDYEMGKFAITKLETKFDPDRNVTTVIINGATGDLNQIPKDREYEIVLYGVNGGKVRVCTPVVSSKDGYTVEIEGALTAENDYKQAAFEILENAWIEIVQKERIYDLIKASGSKKECEELILAEDIDVELKDALMELF